MTLVLSGTDEMSVIKKIENTNGVTWDRRYLWEQLEEALDLTISSSNEMRIVSITENKRYWLFYWAAVFTCYGASFVLLIKIAETKNTNTYKKNYLKEL